MRFFVDAQLPKGIVTVFQNLDHDAFHASALPDGASTSDRQILEYLSYDVCIISKDSDFYDSALIRGRPLKLIYVTCGNQSRRSIIELFDKSASRLVDLLAQYDILEIDMHRIIGLR